MALGELFGEAYYIGEIRKGTYHAPQIAQVRRNAVNNRWDRLIAEIDAACHEQDNCRRETGRGHPISRETVEVGRYAMSKAGYDRLHERLDREPTDEDIPPEDRALVDLIRGWNVGTNVRLLSAHQAVGIQSERYGRSICLYVHDDHVIMHNWGLRGFTTDIEDAWRNASVNGEVRTDHKGPGGACFASVRLPDLEAAKELLR